MATATNSPQVWGGHSVPIVGYDEKQLYVVTWGAIQPMTWAALAKYSDEAYADLDPNWYATDGRTPTGLDLTALQADLAAVAG